MSSAKSNRYEDLTPKPFPVQQCIHSRAVEVLLFSGPFVSASLIKTDGALVLHIDMQQHGYTPQGRNPRLALCEHLLPDSSPTKCLIYVDCDYVAHLRALNFFKMHNAEPYDYVRRFSHDHPGILRLNIALHRRPAKAERRSKAGGIQLHNRIQIAQLVSSEFQFCILHSHIPSQSASDHHR